MSIKTWKEEFYRTPAQRVSKEEAIAHSLKKWEGLTEENLKKHCVEMRPPLLLDTYFDEFIIDARSCSLCELFFERDNEECEECPLHKYLGRPCDEDEGPYTTWSHTENPQPMIEALREILR